MKGTNAVKFFAVILVIAVLTYIAWFGQIATLKIPGAKDIQLGTDVKGGVHAQLQAVTSDGSLPNNDDLDKARTIIEARLDANGITDKTLTVDKTNGRVIVEIPWSQNEKEYNPRKMIDETVKTALLTFQEVDESKIDPATGAFLPTGKIILQGTQVKNTGYTTNNSNQPAVSLEFDSSGAKAFSEATGRLYGKRIAIFMDDLMISAPVVNARIDNGRAIIEGDFTAQEVGRMAALIKSGALPFKMEAVEVNSISPLLGRNALDISIRAGLVAFILICVFMLAYYRLAGLLAVIALIGHTAIQLLMISWLHLVNLTLPGIAGVIITIGMGVDANIIIFERIKEELRNGKTLRAAIDIGFKRAFHAVFDANITTLITAVMLYVFGSGPIKGFGFTLGLGVVLSFLTAVFASRIMLKSIADINIAKHHWLYGA